MSDKKAKRTVRKGRAYVKSTYNNTIITITDPNGNVLASSSGGIAGFKGTRKATPYAASRAAENVVSKVQKYDLSEVDVLISGFGLGRQMAVKSLKSAGLKILSLSDVTPIPHNGCRPKKQPRN
ncbi:30S ribosomal protein S11 [Patescibacteria group bacterium]|nr:30S ribosomal protein S11 [Patescibacteria group bacterium]